jgi:serine/threonine-protein kinase
MINALGFLATLLVPIVTVRSIAARGRGDRPGLWNRLLGGAAGRALFRVAGILAPRTVALPAPGESTVLIVGRAAADLFRGLPAEIRDTLAAVPSLIERLEADAIALRARSGDPSARERLASTVAALEMLRLDLLRLHAGTLTAGELTANLEAVERMGDAVDRRLASAAEVDRLLDDRQPTPS